VKGRSGTYVRILPNHLRNFRRNHFTLLTPCCCALEDGDAFVHDGFEVFGFGVEGWDIRHCDFISKQDMGMGTGLEFEMVKCVVVLMRMWSGVVGFRMGEGNDVIAACLGLERTLKDGSGWFVWACLIGDEEVGFN
jgi:hypothetical protein